MCTPSLGTSGKSCLWEKELESGGPEAGGRVFFFFLMYKLLECKNFVSNDKTHKNFISICTTIHIITWYFLNGTVYLRLDPAEADLKVTCKFLQRQASQRGGGEADEVEQRDS